MAFEKCDMISSLTCIYFTSFFFREGLLIGCGVDAFITPLIRKKDITVKTPAVPNPMLKSALCSCLQKEAMLTFVYIDSLMIIVRDHTPLSGKPQLTQL